MLETRIAELTAAVEALTKAIGGMQAPGHFEVTASLEEIKPAREAPNAITEEAKKSPAISPTSQTSAPESAPVSYDDVKRATNAVSKISREKAIAGLARFGVQSATKLTEAQWPEYVAYMTRVAAGEIDPEASHE